MAAQVLWEDLVPVQIWVPRNILSGYGEAASQLSSKELSRVQIPLPAPQSNFLIFSRQLTEERKQTENELARRRKIFLRYGGRNFLPARRETSILQKY